MASHLIGRHDDGVDLGSVGKCTAIEAVQQGIEEQQVPRPTRVDDSGLLQLR